MMKTIKIDIRYKLIYALTFAFGYLLFLGFEFHFNGAAAKIQDYALVWGIVYLVIYALSISRIKTLFTKENQLIIRSIGGLKKEYIDVKSILQVDLKKRKFLNEVTITTEEDVFTIYPQNELELMVLLEPICKNAIFNITEKE